jgi:hypothetical protein
VSADRKVREAYLGVEAADDRSAGDGPVGAAASGAVAAS